MNKQIEEMAKHCCFPCEMEYDGECIENKKPCECYIALTTAEALYNAVYRKASEVATEIISEIEQSIMAHGTNYAMKRLAELKKKYEVQ